MDEQNNMEQEDEGGSSKLIKQMLTDRGIIPMAGEPECTTWRARHQNCFGCKHELPCNKLVSIMLIQCQSIFYKPASFQESLQVADDLARRTNAIIDAATNEEVKRIAAGCAV